MIKNVIFGFFIMLMALCNGNASHPFEHYYQVPVSQWNDLHNQLEDLNRLKTDNNKLKDELENLQSRIVASRLFPYVLEYTGAHKDELYKKIHKNFLFHEYSSFPKFLIDFFLYLESPSIALTDHFSKMSFDDINHILGGHLQKTSGFKRMFSNMNNDFFETFCINTNNKFSKASFSKDPIENISQKIDLIQKAFLETTTLQRIDHKNNIEYEQGVSTPLSSDIKIPKAEEMIVNLMWIRKEKDMDPNGLLFPENYTRKQVEIGQHQKIDIFERLNEWAENFPKVIFWYDSAMVSEGSLERTQQAMIKKCSHHHKIELRDIRSLNIAKAAQNLLNHPKFIDIPAYVKSDWFRLLVSYEQTKNPKEWGAKNNNFYSLYCDLSLPPFLPESIAHDDLALQNLNKYGFLFSRTSGFSFENNFHIFSHDPDIIESLGFVYGQIFPKLLLDFIEKKYPFDKPLSQHHPGERTLSDSIIHAHLFHFYSFIRHKKREGTWARNQQTIENAIKNPEFITSGECYKWFFPSTIPYNPNSPSEKHSTFALPNQPPQDIEYMNVPTIEVLAPDSNH